MPKQVLKYRITLDDVLKLELPVGSKFVYCNKQTSHLTLWFEVSDGTAMIDRQFQVFATGQPVYDDAIYCGTIMDNGFVWHIYEVFE